MELNNIDLNKLNTFFAVADQGGITRASRRLLLTPSAVSQGVSSLEGALGVRLFNRIGRKLTLAEEGRRLYRSFREYQLGLSRALGSLAAPEAEARGMVRVGLVTGFSKARLTDFLSTFLREHPR